MQAVPIQAVEVTTAHPTPAALLPVMPVPVDAKPPPEGTEAEPKSGQLFFLLFIRRRPQQRGAHWRCVHFHALWSRVTNLGYTAVVVAEDRTRPRIRTPISQLLASCQLCHSCVDQVMPRGLDADKCSCCCHCRSRAIWAARVGRPCGVMAASLWQTTPLPFKTVYWGSLFPNKHKHCPTAYAALYAVYTLLL